MSSPGTLHRSKASAERLSRPDHFAQELCSSVPNNLQRLHWGQDATRHFQGKGLEPDQAEASETASTCAEQLPGIFSVPSPPPGPRVGGASSPMGVGRLNVAEGIHGAPHSGSHGTPPRPSRHHRSNSTFSGGILHRTVGDIAEVGVASPEEITSTLKATWRHRRAVSALSPNELDRGTPGGHHSPGAVGVEAAEMLTGSGSPSQLISSGKNKFAFGCKSERFDKTAAASAILPPLPKTQSLPTADQPKPHLTPRGVLAAYHDPQQYLSLLPEEDEEGMAPAYQKPASGKDSLAARSSQWLRSESSLDSLSPSETPPTLKLAGSSSAPSQKFGSLPPPHQPQHQRPFKLGLPRSPGSSSPSPSSSPLSRAYSPLSKGPKRLPVAALSPLSSTSSIVEHMVDQGYTRSGPASESPTSRSPPPQLIRQLPTCGLLPRSSHGFAGDVIGGPGHTSGEPHQSPTLIAPAYSNGKLPKHSAVSGLSPLLFSTNQQGAAGMYATGTPQTEEGDGTSWHELEGIIHSKIILSPPLGTSPLPRGKLVPSASLDSTAALLGRLSPHSSTGSGTPPAHHPCAGSPGPVVENSISTPLAGRLAPSASVDAGRPRLTRMASGSAILSSVPALDGGIPRADRLPHSPSIDSPVAPRGWLSPTQSADSKVAAHGPAKLGHARLASSSSVDSGMPPSGQLSPSLPIDGSSLAFPSHGPRRARRSLGRIPRTTSDLLAVDLSTSAPDDSLAVTGSPAQPKLGTPIRALSRLPRSASVHSSLCETAKARGPGEPATGLAALKKWQEAQIASKQWPSAAAKPSAPKAPKPPPLTARPARRAQWRTSHSDSFALQPSPPPPGSPKEESVPAGEWPEAELPAGKGPGRGHGVKLAVGKHKQKHKGSASLMTSLPTALSIDCGAPELGPADIANSLAGFYFEKGQDVSVLLQGMGPGPSAAVPAPLARGLSASLGDERIKHRPHHSVRADDLSNFVFSGPDAKGAKDPLQEGTRKLLSHRKSVGLGIDGSKGRVVAGLTPRDYVLEQEYEDIRPYYAMHKDELGSGQFGVIRKCIDIYSGVLYACKTLNKKNIQSADDADDIRREVACLSILRGHPTVVGLRGTFEDNDNIHLIMDLCHGGDLFDRVKTKGQLAERDAAKLCRSLVEALLHCHCLGITHRDIKPENILMVSPSSDANIKLVDFGIATFFKPNEDLTAITGTLEYMAPEVIKGCYGPEADIWSAGVVMYITVSGIQPFWASSQPALAACILNKEPSFASKRWGKVSAECKDLIRRMLTKDRTKRISATEILSHAWIQRYATL